MSFTYPLALILTLLLPYFVWLAAPAAGRRWREWSSLGARLLIGLLLILSLAGSRLARAADEVAVVFLIDASDSMTTEQAAQAEAFVREAVEQIGPEERAAVVLFGANSVVERPMSQSPHLPPFASLVQSRHTNIAEAIQLGLALFPAGADRRLVLLSDGQETVGNAREAARLAAASGVPVDVVPLPAPGIGPEAWLTNVHVPARVVQGELFQVRITAESNVITPAALRILSGGRVIYEEQVTLNAGVNHYNVRLRAAEQAFARYTVQLEPERDTIRQNNQLAAFTEIVGPPRILIVSGEPAEDEEVESAQIRQALTAAGLLVEETPARTMPSAIAELNEYAGLILVNVDAGHMTPRQLQAIEQYTRDLGGGLLVIGGPRSYGMGRYSDTPLEALLPVNLQIEDEERFPSVSIVIVIDRSGSMGMSEGEMTKIQLAAEAAVRVVELLNDWDEITVIPVDTRPFNPVGPMKGAERERLIQEIRQISAGGGGIYMRTGLEAAHDVLRQSDSPVQHVIVLADGADAEEKEGVPERLAQMTAEGITISMVAIGDGVDVPWLEEMAPLGQGRFHFTDRAANLPEIFVEETTLIQRSYLVEEAFFPTLANPSPILAGIQAVPPLYGYVATSPKAASQVILESHWGDPLLAGWQYGLGRVLAWTSDATGRWALDWVRWDGFPVFWAQAARWTLASTPEGGVEATVRREGDGARLVVDARDGQGRFINDLELMANVVSPAGTVERIALRQVAPGRYESLFYPDEEGAYLLRIQEETATEDENGQGISQTVGWVMGYSAEYLPADGGTALLMAVADISGGRDISHNPAAAFDRAFTAEVITRPIWPWLALLAVALLPLDVALRRLALSRRDVSQGWQRMTARLRRRPAAAVEQPEQVARLFQAKERAAAGRPAEKQPPPIAPPSGQSEPPPQQKTGAPQKETAPKEDTPSRPEPGTLAARLLDKKRRQQEDEAKKE